MIKLSTLSVPAGLTLLGIAGLAGYSFGVRPWHRRWGVSDAEIARSMAGDELVQNPTYVTNRGVSIWARPAVIWPWLAQMGEVPRGGFYSYEWIERLLGLRVSNASWHLPEAQHLEVGDALDRGGQLVVKAIKHDQWLVLGSPEQSSWGTSTWSMGLYPLDEEHTRLVSRVRARVDRWTPRMLLWAVLLDPGQFVMERKWLLGVKERAEFAAYHRQQQGGVPPLPIAG